jgi:hypothetical protein
MVGTRLLATLGLVQSPVPVDGTVHPDFVSVVDALRWQLAAYPGGAAVCVYHRGDCVATSGAAIATRPGARGRATRWRRASRRRRVSPRRLCTSSPIGDSSTTTLRSPPTGPSSRPAARTRSRSVTSSPTSRASTTSAMVDRAERMLDWDHMIHAIERATPVHPPGMNSGMGNALRRSPDRPHRRRRARECEQAAGDGGSVASIRCRGNRCCCGGRVAVSPAPLRRS